MPSCKRATTKTWGSVTDPRLPLAVVALAVVVVTAGAIAGERSAQT